MRVQAETSEIFVDVNGVSCRVWNAVTEDGEQMFLFVSLVATREDFSAKLNETFVEIKGDSDALRLEKAQGS